MGIHPFQVSDLNNSFMSSSSKIQTGGALASEFAIVPDNINGNASRYVKLMAVWSDVALQGTANPSSTNADSYGQATGQGNSTTDSQPWRPNAGYFERGLWFANTATPATPAGSPAGYRNGYVGSWVSGLINLDYGHDPNNLGNVDYEPVYGHGVATWPMTADIPHQWLDSTSSPSDGTDLITNASSAYSRTPYMPASYFLFHIASSGSNTLGSGDVKFFLENRPTLRMAGFSDSNSQSNIVPSWSGTNIPSNGGLTYAYTSDPLRNYGGLNTAATQNFHEYYQVTGVRKLNSRGLSFHLAKVFDNGPWAMSYPYEEDGITLGTGCVVTSGNIQTPYPQVNNQQEYVWAGGRDVGAQIISTSVTSNVVTIIANNTFSANQVVYVQGLTNQTWLNGSFLTVLSSGLSATQFEATVSHSNYTTQTETLGMATFAPDFRVRQGATFIINEEYYGLVMDTKCTIWSNKSSMFPLLFFDLGDNWTASVAKRIAGVSVVPVWYTSNSVQTLGYQVFFLSEDGYLARYDFTQNLGVLELAGSGSFSFAANAPAVASPGEAYGALRTRNTNAAITASSVTGNTTLTVTANNTFEVGESVNIVGTAESSINNTTVTVATLVGAGPVYTGFTATIPTTSNYTNASDTGTATGYSLWAVYGTMTPDPRNTQTPLINTARIAVIRYLVGSGAWGTWQFSPNTGRHNGRSLSEMIIARDDKLYILCEDVTVTGSTPNFQVVNAFGSITNINWQVMAYDPTVPAWNSSKINGTSPIQYGTNQGPIGTSQSDSSGGNFWFYDINAFLFDVGVGTILVQANWTAGAIFTLSTTGSTASLSNSNLTSIPASTLFANDSFIPSVTNPATDPVSITHARDFATNADRTVMILNYIQSNRPSPPAFPLYLAPPSFNWASPTTLTPLQINSLGSNPSEINSFGMDEWTVTDLSAPNYTSFGGRWSWFYPTQITDNYIHFLRIAAGGDNLPVSIYGRTSAQSLGYIPTYWKWTGSAWAMADSFSDALANPYPVSNAYVNVPLPYGLQVQFGQTGGGTPPYSSWTFGEFHTWNLCWGNTKFARKMRSSWAQFAGQTFTNAETRLMSNENSIALYFHDTDAGGITWTAPTSVTPQTATLNTPSFSWTTAAYWNMLDTANAPLDASPLQLVWTPNTFSPGTYAYPAATPNNVTGSNPYSWTPGSFTYVSSSSGETSQFPSWQAFAGNPDIGWQANSGSGAPWTLQLDLGSGNSQVVLSYGFRPLFQAGDSSAEYVPISWTLQASNNGTFTDNGGGPFIVDTRSSVTPSRGYAFSCNGTTGSYRYYRLNITACTGAWPCISMFRMSTAVLQSACSFVDLVLFPYGSTPNNTSYVYHWNRQWNFSRGHKFEVSTNNGTSYTTITPLWRAHNGYAYSFERQTGVTNLRITVQHGFTTAGTPSNPFPSNTTAFGPFYLIDYGQAQSTLDATRIGSSVATVGTAAAASFDPNCLGIATDVPDLSIDGSNPSLYTPNTANVSGVGSTQTGILEDGAVLGFWDFYVVQNSCFKIHPFFGFVLFQNAGPDGATSNQTGTNLALNYQWGRRI